VLASHLLCDPTNATFSTSASWSTSWSKSISSFVFYTIPTLTLLDRHGIHVIRQTLADRPCPRSNISCGPSYHVAPISVNSTVAELTPSLNQKLLPHQERETHKPSLKERGRGKFTAVHIVSFVFLIHTRAYIGAYGEAGCYCHPTVAEGRLRPSGQSRFSWRQRHDVSHEIRIYKVNFLTRQ
jgi:hypothetical protein